MKIRNYAAFLFALGMLSGCSAMNKTAEPEEPWILVAEPAANPKAAEETAEPVKAACQ